MKKIDESLKKYAMRLRFARALRGTAIGALVGSAAATVLAMLDRSGAFYASWAMLAACFATSAVAGALVGFVLRVDKSTLADSVDRRLGLRDRLRSSLENEEGDFHRAVIADTESQLSKLGNKNAFPLRLSRWHGAAILGMMFACGIFLLGNTPLFLSDAERAEREDLKVHAEQIRKVAKPIIDRDEVSTAEERELAERLEKLAKDLERGRMTNAN